MATARTSTPKSFTADEHGGSIITVVVALVVLIQFVSFAIDLGSTWTEQRRMQIGTDAAALAAVNRYVKNPATISSTILAQAELNAEAVEVAEANGLPSAALAAGGGVVPGSWNRETRIFTAGATPLNAVRVSARGTLPVLFGGIMGFDFLEPFVTSTAIVGGANNVTCMVPFGIDDDIIKDKEYGDILDIESPSPGNWGKLDVDDINSSSRPVFIDAMLNGMCGATLSIGEEVEVGTGIAGLKDGFDGRIEVNPIVIMPVVNFFGNGNSQMATVTGFIVAELIFQQGNGKKWSGDIRLLDQNAGSGVGGPLGPPYATSRVLVE